jgi:hypothetical protein
MRIKTLVLGAALIGITAPAFADFYVVQGPDKHCRTGEQRPVTKEMTVGPDGMYHSDRGRRDEDGQGLRRALV